jgi:phosphoribosyl 1,2-cyclic phosphodiesterase
LRYTVLASGSGGNASLIECGGFGVLIDVGLGPRQLASRLVSRGLSWAAVQAVLLTHTHSDHWKDPTLSHLLRRRIALYCHPSHHTVLRTYSALFGAMVSAGLVHSYDPEQPLQLTPDLVCRPFAVRHDGGATFGFRFESARDLLGQSLALAYAADLGSWNEELVQLLSDVDLLAVEFNHDVGMQHASGRTPRLIARVLGDEGHLSNDQAAALLRAILERSTPGRLRYLVQLHLSQECNRPGLARDAARRVLDELRSGAELHTASQDTACSSLSLHAIPQRRSRPPRPGPQPQPWLPGFEGHEEGG